MHSRKAVVIGSGVAGLATAIRLAVRGFEVDVFEKNESPGGKISWFEKDGFSFDGGPSLFTNVQLLEDLFHLAGESYADHISCLPVDISCKYFFADGKVINAYRERNEFIEELQSEAGEDPQKLAQYLDRTARLYQRIGTVFMGHSLHKWKTWMNRGTLLALSAARPAYLFRSLHQLNSSWFHSKEAIQIFDRFATYVGSDPFRAPAMLSMIAHFEFNQGVFYPRGGMRSIVTALYSLAVRTGVQFHFNTPVQQIIHNKRKVEGIEAGGGIFKANIVISNVDIYFTHFHLLNDQARVKQLLLQERSSSALVFYWGMKKLFPQLQLHNIFFSANYREEFKNLFQSGNLPHDPTVYVNITSKMDPAHAPVGKENWFVMLNVPSHPGQYPVTLRERGRQSIIQKLNSVLGVDLESMIEVEDCLDPAKIALQTGSFEGSIYGTSSNSRFSAFLRHPNFSRKIGGLYFVGGSVHPGGGIPLCLNSAAIVSKLIQ